jgi:hypothetical protein
MSAIITQRELKDLLRLGTRCGLLVLPFLLAQVLELFVLPIDFFTFRVWEAALAVPYRYPGAYYPNLHLKKAREFGDHYREGDPGKVQSKPVEWFTDAYGYRNRPEMERKSSYDAVVLGDSNIVGSFLDQKDTLTEVMSARSGKTVYSYSIGADHISLFFSDPRFVSKSVQLLAVESKVGNWDTNSGYLNNFRAMPDGSLDVVDRSPEFANYYSSKRNFFLERIESQLTKQAMFHWFEANLAAGFTLPSSDSGQLFIGRRTLGASERSLYRITNWIASRESIRPLPERVNAGLMMRASAPNAYWHTERFVSKRPDGKIVVRFEAKNSLTPSRHRMWIFEDGHYRTVGEFVAEEGWRYFDIPIAANPGSILEFQIDQPDEWQWLSVRNFQVVGGGEAASIGEESVGVPLSSWTGDSSPCGEADKGGTDCRRWPVVGKNAYIQTPVLPQPGDGGMLIRFEARADKPASEFSSIYLFEGSQYRKVSQYAFDTTWRECRILVQADPNARMKVQVDLPDSVGSLEIRDFRISPARRL